jgi:hypothetical protein
MNWGRFLLVVLIASVATSFSDWLFMGVLFHDKYQASPELWRSSAGQSERSLVLYSQLIGVLSCGAFAYLCTQAPGLTVPASLGAALIVWLAGPVVVLAQMVLWTKLHPLIGTSQSLGWLVRFSVTGLLAVWLLGGAASR